MVTLPKKCQNFLRKQKIHFEGRDEGGQKAVILKNFILPEGRFDVSKADILILLPSGYPDAPPDMFHTMPCLRLTSSGNSPRGTGSVGFDGQTWQRWSRHNDEWRPGVDGIWTMIKRIERALEIAQ